MMVLDDPAVAVPPPVDPTSATSPSSPAGATGPAVLVRLRTGRYGTLVTKLARCMSVSVLTTLISLATLAVLTAMFGMRAWVANVVATLVGTVPSYLLNRRWVWQRSGAHDPWREVVPFWTLSMFGLVASTVAVDRADRFASALALSGVAHTAALLFANLSAFGLLWVGQFLLLDRVLFAPRRSSAASLKERHL